MNVFDDESWRRAAREYNADRNNRAAPRIRHQGDEEHIGELSRLSELEYGKVRRDAARSIGIQVSRLDKVVRAAKAQSEQSTAGLPHWNVEPWNEEVRGAELLDEIEKLFRRYIVLPQGADTALALWVLHAWTIDAGDISPFLVLISPTKRCGKTNTLIVLFYLTPRSELASNISPSALFRYVEDVHPTLLIDEADSFMKDNEEMRGILNSGHTKPAVHVIRNVEVNGEHKPRRFSTWAAKGIATIRALADTLEDRSIVVQLQRKPKAASVDRLRKRDNDEFAVLRRRAARWAADNFSKLTDPEPDIPEVLNDRAADNWRPLLAIADLAGGAWPKRARDAACLLSGDGHDSTSVNVELLADIRLAFGETDVIRSADLVAKLIADPERPWVEWRHGKALTQKQLGGLLRPFGITSETVSVPGLDDAKGYKRIRFEENWEAYLPGQNTFTRPPPASEASKRRNADGTGTSHDFRSVADDIGDGSKNANLFNNGAGSDASTLRKPGNGRAHVSDQEFIPSPPSSSDGEEEARTCVQCRGPVDGKEQLVAVGGGRVRLHPECKRFYLRAGHFQSSEACKRASADEMGTSPDFRSVRETTPHGSKNAHLSNNHAGLHACTDRKPGNGAGSEFDQGSGIPTTGPCGDLRYFRRERLGPPAISSGPDDDLADLQ